MSEKARRYQQFYMDVAARAAELSFAKRRKVGAIAVHEGNIIGFGFNGTPPGFPNECEDANGETLPYVIHAEDNLVRKLKSNPLIIPLRFDVYVTKEPCANCAIILEGMKGLRRVFYRDASASKPGAGLQYLTDNGVEVYRVELPSGDQGTLKHNTLRPRSNANTH